MRLLNDFRLFLRFFKVLTKLIRTIYFDAKKYRCSRLRLEDATLSGCYVQHGVVSLRVIDEWYVDSCRQVLIDLGQVSD